MIGVGWSKQEKNRSDSIFPLKKGFGLAYWTMELRPLPSPDPNLHQKTELLMPFFELLIPFNNFLSPPPSRCDYDT